MQSLKLKDNINFIKNALGNSNELVVKEMQTEQNSCGVLYFMGLSDTVSISKFILEPLLHLNTKLTAENTPHTLPLAELEKESDEKKLISSLLKGKGILLIDGEKDAFILGVDKFKERAISEPPTSTVLKGPRAGFVENLKTNLSILRKILMI